MARLVHLTDEKNANSILKNGIKVGKHNNGVYCMPLLGNYFISYQWLRELKRKGGRSIVAVHFNMHTNEKVWAGKYHEEHKRMTVAEAFNEVKKLNDPLGYEVFIERKITPKEIKKINKIPQNIGWRYQPHSHRNPIKCGCLICIPKGSIKSKKLRLKLGYTSDAQKVKFSTYVKEIKEAVGPMTICDLLLELGLRKWKKNPIELSFLTQSKWKEVQEVFVSTLPSFKFKYSKHLLLDLIHNSPFESVREKACETLLLYDKELFSEIKFLKTSRDE